MRTLISLFQNVWRRSCRFGCWQWCVFIQNPDLFQILIYSKFLHWKILKKLDLILYYYRDFFFEIANKMDSNWMIVQWIHIVLNYQNIDKMILSSLVNWSVESFYMVQARNEKSMRNVNIFSNRTVEINWQFQFKIVEENWNHFVRKSFCYVVIVIFTFKVKLCSNWCISFIIFLWFCMHTFLFDNFFIRNS